MPVLISTDDGDDDADVSYIGVLLSAFQEEFSDYEANDPWVQNLIFNLDGLLTSFKVSSASFSFTCICCT